MSNKRTGPFPVKHRQTIHDRCYGLCEHCHLNAVTEVHHRRFLSRGGKHNLANLIGLCGSGNHSGCHGLAHSANPPDGLAIKAADKRHETEIPFTDARGIEWVLDDIGGRQKKGER